MKITLKIIYIPKILEKKIYVNLKLNRKLSFNGLSLNKTVAKRHFFASIFPLSHNSLFEKADLLEERCKDIPTLLFLHIFVSESLSKVCLNECSYYFCSQILQINNSNTCRHTYLSIVSNFSNFAVFITFCPTF